MSAVFPCGASATNGGDLSVSFVSAAVGGFEQPTSTSVWRVTNVGDAAVDEAFVSYTFDEGSGPSPFGGIADITGIGRATCSDLLGGTPSGCSVLETIPPGASFDLTLGYYAHLQPGENTLVRTSVQIVAPGDANSSNDTATHDVLNAMPAPAAPPGAPHAPMLPVAPPPRVQMDSVATTTAPSAKVGDLVTIRYTITNDGTIEPSQYAFNPIVDGPAALISATSPDAVCSNTNGMLCDFNRLLPGKPVTLDVVVRPTAPGTISLRSNWVARPYAAPLWQYFFSSSGSLAFSATARTADLSTTVRFTGKTAHVVVTNNGPDDALDVVVRLIPHGLQVHSARGQDVTCGETARCTVEKLGNARSVTLVVAFGAAREGKKSLTVTAGSAGIDPVRSNNRATAPVAAR